MKIIECIDIKIPRIDGKGQVDTLTVGKFYEVLAVRNTYFYRIKNDLGKVGNYMKIRFRDVNTIQ